MFQDRIPGNKPRASYSDRYPREKVIGALVLGTAIFMAGFMAGHDYKATPATPATPASPAPTGPASPELAPPGSVPSATLPASSNTPYPANTMPARSNPDVPAIQLAPMPKLASDLAPLPKVAATVVAKAPDDPAPAPKVAAPAPKTVEKAVVTPKTPAAKPKGTAAPATLDGKS